MKNLAKTLALVVLSGFSTPLQADTGSFEYAITNICMRFAFNPDAAVVYLQKDGWIQKGKQNRDEVELYKNGTMTYIYTGDEGIGPVCTVNDPDVRVSTARKLIKNGLVENYGKDWEKISIDGEPAWKFMNGGLEVLLYFHERAGGGTSVGFEAY